MSYNFDLKISANVTKDVTEQMIKQIVEEQTGKKVVNIEWVIKDKSIDGCNITFAEEKSKNEVLEPISKRPKFKIQEYEQVGRF